MKKHEYEMSRAERQLEANKGCLVLCLIALMAVLGMVLWWNEWL